jgi:hypothetical protein
MSIQQIIRFIQIKDIVLNFFFFCSEINSVSDFESLFLTMIQEVAAAEKAEKESESKETLQ